MSMRLSGVSPEVQEHVATVIESAANYIVENGWHQGRFAITNKPTACAATALLIAGGHISAPGDPFRVYSDEAIRNDLAFAAFAGYLRENYGDEFDDGDSNFALVWRWNDAKSYVEGEGFVPRRTEDEVLTALMSASGSLRQGARVAA